MYVITYLPLLSEFWYSCFCVSEWSELEEKLGTALQAHGGCMDR